MKLSVPALRGAWWAARATRRARLAIPHGLPDDAKIPDPPALPPGGVHGVLGYLRRRPQTCLVRALVLQRWYRAQGDRRDLVIGVTAPSRGFSAHAWLAGDQPCHAESFQEILRQPAH